MKVLTVIVLLALGGANGGPVNMQHNDYTAFYGQSSDCGTRCTSSNKFKYQIGKTYQYEYEVSTSTSLYGASEDAARIDVRATVNVYVFSKCEMLLSFGDNFDVEANMACSVIMTTEDWLHCFKLGSMGANMYRRWASLFQTFSNVLSGVTISRSVVDQNQMEDVDGGEFKGALERNSLRFSFQDGRIDELCPSAAEDTRSLNFKRGVLSALQNSMNQLEKDESLKEIDVTGTCPTEYIVTQKGWKSVQFTKTKDLLGCVDRHDYRTSLQSTPFRLPDAIQSLPLLKGNYKCTQMTAREGHLMSSICVESLVFRPFSKKESGARTETTQKINFVTSQSGNILPRAPVTSKTTLLFEHKQSFGSSDQTLWSAKEKLTELCRVTMQDIPAEAPDLFTDIVYLMRSLDTIQLTDISDRVDRGNICEGNKKKAKKFFLDALPMVGTTSSIEMMVNMLLTGEVTDTQAELWMASLHFVQHPKIEMISQLKRLLLSENHRMSALLPVTSLINNLCHSQFICLTSTEVSDTVDILNDILGNDCQSVEQDLIFITLRAAGNLGYSDQLKPTLETCFKLSRNPLNIRVAAVQAFRGITCNADRRGLMETFLNKDEDSELRIAAYLAVMQCWDEAVLKQVKQALEMEPVNQVGSFVWTHLTNLMKSSSLFKQELRDILQDEKLEKEFNMDRRKYSRNYEVSYFSDKFGAGLMTESNIIWSSKSFLPRSAMVNLTVDMFGHSVNLLEVGGRVEGLELILQNYFGSSGLFKGGEKPKDGTPSRCVKQQKMEVMKEKFKVNKDELTASVYFRIFGNELGFHHFTAKEIMSIADRFSTKDILATLAKGYDISQTQSALFMDSSMSVPTLAGMTLSLSVNGTATVELMASGKMDLRKFSLKKMEASFDVRPSGAVQLSGMMSLDAGATRSGLKMVTTLHTSTSASGIVDLTNGQVLSVELDTPKRNMDILDIKSEFFTIHNHVEKKQQMLKEKQVNQHSCSPEIVLKVTGYELCGAVSFINSASSDNAPYFPFNGPVSVSISVHKKDAPRGFKLTGKHISNQATSIAHLSFDTPGSLIERGITIGRFLDRQAKSVEVELSSPWKKLLAKGAYTVEPKTRKLMATLLVDGREHKFNLQVDEKKQKGKTIWSPYLEIVRPKDSKFLATAPEKLGVDGKFELSDDYTDISVNLNINSGLKPDPIEIKGNFLKQEGQKSIVGVITLNKNESYSATFQILQKMESKKSSLGTLEPTILISAPKWKLFLLSGSIDYKENKFYKGNIQILMDKTLKKPIILDFKLTKQNKGAVNQIRGQSKFDCQYATVKTKGNVNLLADLESKKGPLLTASIQTEYIIGSKIVPKNKIVISTKVYNRSSSALQKYSIDFNMDSKNEPNANLIANMELSHKDTLSKSVLTLRRGGKAKFTNDKSQELRVETSIDHKIDKASADIRWGALVIYPQENIEYEIKGKHEHSTKNKFIFETYNAAIYDKGKSIEFRAYGSDNSENGKMDASGTVEMSFPAFEIDDRKYESKHYKLGSSVMQATDDEYIHTVNLQVNKKEKHSLVTKFKKDRNENVSLYSQLQIDGDYPSKLTLSASKDTDSVNGAMEFLGNGSIYKADVTSRLIGKYQMNTWDILWQERRIKGLFEVGQKQETGGTLKFESAWDVNRDPTQKISSEVHYLIEEYRKNMKGELLLTLSTPFENHKLYTYHSVAERSHREMKEELKLIWGNIDNQLAYSFWLLLPPSLERFEMKSSFITPFTSVRKAGMEIMHKFDGSRHLSSSIKGIYNNDDISVAVLIANTGDPIRNGLDSSFAITSTIPSIRKILLKIKHNDDGKVYVSEGLYERNSAQYRINLNTTYAKRDHQLKIGSDLVINVPSERPATVTWIYSTTITSINSSLSFNWKPDYDSKLIVGIQFNKGKDYALDLTFTGPWQNFKSLEIQFRHSHLTDTEGSLLGRVNMDPNLTSKVTYRYTGKEISISCFCPKSQSSLKVHFENYPYTASLEQVWQDKQQQNRLNVEASVDKNMQGWLANLKLVTPWKKVRNVNFHGNLKNLSRGEWKLDSLISVDVGKKINAEFMIDTGNWNKMNGLIQTPYEEFTSMSFGFTRKEENSVYNSDAYLEVQPVFNKIKMEYSISPNVPNVNTRLYFDLPDTEIKFLEVKVDNVEVRRGHTNTIKVRYYPEKEINYKFTGRYNELKFPENTKVTIDLSTPYTILPSLNLKADIDKVKDKWISVFDFKSTMKALEYLNVQMSHENTDTSSNTDLTIASSVFETVSAGLHFDFGDTVGSNVTLLAPSVGRTMIGFKKRFQSWVDFQNQLFIEFNGRKFDVDVGLKHNEKLSKAWLLYDCPNANHSYIQTTIYCDGKSSDDFDVGGFLQVGRDSEPFNVSLQYSMITDKYALGTTLETPYTKSISYLLKYESNNKESSSTVYCKCGQKYLVDMYSYQMFDDGMMSYNSRNTITFDGETHTAGTIISAKWSDQAQEATIKGYCYDKQIKVTLDRKSTSAGSDSGSEMVNVMVFTNFENFRDIGMQTVINMQPAHYHGSCNVEYMDDNEAVLKFDLSQPNQNSANLNAVLTLPLENYQRNTLTYTHTSRQDQFTADAEVLTGKGEKLQGKLEFKNRREYVLTLTGPLQEFESIIISGTYKEEEQKTNGFALLKLTLNSQPARLDYDIENLTMNFKLSSPYKNWQRADLTIQHDGKDWKKFRTVSVLQCDKLGRINSETVWRFNSLSDMEGSSKLTSVLKNIENLKLGFSTKDRSNNQVSHLEVGWSTDKEIRLENSWSLLREKNSVKFLTNLGIATPFDELKLANVKLSHSYSDDMTISDSILLDHNGKSYLDMDLNYQYALSRHEGNVDLRSPQPMSFLIVGSVNENLLDGTIKFNWDKLSPESNIELVSIVADRSEFPNIDREFKFKVIHPVRIMGLDCMYKKANHEILSSALLTFDEQNGNTFSYDIGWINRTSVYSQMYDGHIKLGVPKRSVKVQGSYSDTGSIVTTTTAVLWDADKDEKKKVTMTTSVENKDSLKRVSLNINVPYINKQLNLDATTKGSYGSTLVASRAEISYSSDPKKMFVVTSVISNSHAGSSQNYNYTMDIGVDHQITGTDIQILSHVGRVDTLCSVGGQLNYLTVNKERKTVAFLIRQDKAKKNIEIKAVTPLKTIGLEGQVNVMPDQKQLLVKSFEDDKQALILDVLLNQKRKSVDVEFSYDQDDLDKKLKLTGHLVNDSTLQVNLISQNDKQMTTQSVVAVRLNTSNVLHTRVFWRPTMFNEWQDYMGTKVTAFSYAANEAFSLAVDSVGSEVKARYLLVSQELRSEMSQVFQLMDKEMSTFSEQLETLRTNIRRFYQRNDLHIRDMGEQIKKAFDELLLNVRDLVENYRSYCASITRATHEWLADLKTYPIAQKYAVAIEDLAMGLKSLREVLEETLNEVAFELDKFSEQSYIKYLEISRAIDRKLNSYTQSLHNLAVYRTMAEQRAYLEKLGADTSPAWAQLYNHIYLKSHELLQDQFHDLMSREEFQYIHAVMNEMHQQLKHYSMEQSLNNAVKRVIDLSKNLILMELTKLKNGIIDFKNSHVIIYDPERGELQLEIHLPFTLKSLVDSPEFNVEKKVDHMIKWAKMNLQSPNASIWDLYYQYVPSLEPSSWVPPFEASAYLIGAQHYITFDKIHYDFLSTCSHVLTRDMVHDNFSVIVNYEKTPSGIGVKSLCFTIEDLTFDILDDYKLEVDNRETEMPFITDKVQVVREGDFIRVEYIGVLEVLSNPKLKLYKVTVQGWYHGQLAGLLGKYDNEHTDDEKIEEMASQFEVNRRSCNFRNQALTADPSSDKDNMCGKAFDESLSKYTPCFKQVDLAPFVQMCKIYMAKMEENEAIHLVTEQYRYVCQGHGVFIGALEDYIPCNSDGPFTVDGTDPLYQSADVLFIVEDNICNQWAATSLANMVTDINRALTSAGMNDNRFGLESYGGINEEVLVRTLNGQQFGEASLFLKALETLSLVNNIGIGNLATAIRTARNYPYRPGVAKVLIIVPCSSCEVSFLERNFGNKLKSEGFSVHVLQEQSYRYDVEGNIRRTYKVYGLDNSKVFTNHLSDEVVSLEQVHGKKDIDYCVTLAQATNGSVFDTSHLSDKPHIQREFIQAFAQRVGWNTKLPPCQNCKCSAQSGRVECLPCDTKLIYSVYPWNRPSLSEVIGSLHDFNHDVKTYFGVREWGQL